jgi:hypothetical protein
LRSALAASPGRGLGAGGRERLGRLAAFLGDGDQQPLGGDEGVARRLGVGFSALANTRAISGFM